MILNANILVSSLTKLLFSDQAVNKFTDFFLNAFYEIKQIARFTTTFTYVFKNRKIVGKTEK